MVKSTAIFDVLSESIAIRMLSCNEANHPGDWTETQMHADYDLWLVRDGEVEVQIGASSQMAGPGDWVFFYPGVPYTARAATDACRFIFAHFEFGIGERSGMLQHFPLAGVVPGSRMEEEGRHFSKIFDSGRLEDGLTRLRLKGSLTLVVARILQLHAQGRYSGLDAAPANKRSRIRQLDALREVLAAMHARLHESVSVADLAREAGMSEKYFIAYFKRALGVTPGQYMYQMRMNKARDYLYNRRAYSIQEIAAMLGYADAYTFSKAFKKYYNVAPSRFV